MSNDYGINVTKISIDSTAYTVDNDAGIITTDLSHLKSQTSNPSTTSVAYGNPDTAIIIDVFGNEDMFIHHS